MFADVRHMQELWYEDTHTMPTTVTFGGTFLTVLGTFTLPEVDFY